MPSKRKRSEGINSPLSPLETPTAPNRKPLSAIAAARLRADALKLVASESTLVRDPVFDALGAASESPIGVLDDLEEEHEPITLKQNFKLCNWRNDNENIISKTTSELTVKLDKHSTIALLGCFQLQVLKGAININGANIGAISHLGRADQLYSVFVPATHHILKIRGLDIANHVRFTSAGIPMPLVHLSQTFRDIWAAPTKKGDQKTFTVVRRIVSFLAACCLKDYILTYPKITESEADLLRRPLSPERTPEDWLRAIEECSNNPSISCVVGPSSCGKSTIAKRLLNRYLTGQGKSARPLAAVCYLDLDSIQPEYTPHGQISLILVRCLNLGPNFTHFAAAPFSHGVQCDEVVRAHPIPLDLANYMNYFMACAEDLFQTYQNLLSRDPSLPLVINTSGSLYSSAFDTLIGLLSQFKPHNIIHMGNLQAIDIEAATKFHSLQTLSTQFRATVYETTTQLAVNMPLRTESELKAMQMQSFFHMNSPWRIDLNDSYWTSEVMSAMVPWEFCYRETSGRSQEFIGFAMYCEPTEPSSLANSVDGAIVQIVLLASTAPALQTSLSRTSKLGIPYLTKSDRNGMVEPLDPRNSTLICSALIRGFDPERNIVQVLFPRAFEELAYSLDPERTVMVGGCCELPEWAYLEEDDATSRVGTDELSMYGKQSGSKTWVDAATSVEKMGYLNTVRRVRKYQT